MDLELEAAGAEWIDAFRREHCRELSQEGWNWLFCAMVHLTAKLHAALRASA